MSKPYDKPKITKLTQKKLADTLVKQVRRHLAVVQSWELEEAPLNGLIILRDRLDDVLNDAQNPPPEGKADGTVDDVMFTRARRVQRALVDLVDACFYWATER